MGKDTTIISLGGSLVAPKEGVDVSFLKSFSSLIEERVKEGRTFVIIVGGGSTCRVYQRAAGEVRELSNNDLDWLGIYTTHFHAHFLKILFGDLAHPSIVTDPTLSISQTHSVVISGGWKPGWSTDYDAVLIAKQLGAKRIVNLSNIDYVFSEDPRKNPNATKFEKISWKEYRDIIPKEWSPGLSTPFDPRASEEAEKQGHEVLIASGASAENMADAIDGKPFKGTHIVS